jgi:hypothetical protein
MPNPIRIQAADGSVVDLAAILAEAEADVAVSDRSGGLLCADDSRKLVVVCRALVAALSVPYTQDEDRSSDPVLDEGYDIAIGHVRQSARVVEE